MDFSLALSPAPNETSQATVWAVPMAHAWESWSDARAYDGTATILQPQALPLYDGISMHAMLALFTEPVPLLRSKSCRRPGSARMAQDFAQVVARCAGEWRHSGHRQSESRLVLALGRGTSDATTACPIIR